MTVGLVGGLPVRTTLPVAVQGTNPAPSMECDRRRPHILCAEKITKVQE